MKKNNDEHLQQHLTEQFLEQYRKRFNETETAQIQTLLGIYYRYVSDEDLAGENSADLIGAAIAHWQLLRERHTDAPGIRVYNPTFEEHGWQCRHTVIEVVTDDMAFLVDSLSMGLNRAGLTIQLTIHPVVMTRRDRRGRLLEISAGGSDGRAESMIAFQVEKQLDPAVLQALEQMMRSIIGDIVRANSDWQAMRQQVLQITRQLDDAALPLAVGERAESSAFLDWIVQDHFTFLAWCEFDLQDEDGQLSLHIDDDSLLGLFAGGGREGYEPATVIPDLGRDLSNFPCHLVVTKANARSTVHRPAYMDFIGVKRYDDQGRVNGLSCIVGLFTLAAYSSPPSEIPLLRQKVAEVANSARLAQNGHSARLLHSILESFPRDALFQISSGELGEIALGIIGLQERQRTRLFMFRDAFRRFYSCLVYLPREQYNRDLRLRIQKVLVEAFQGTEVEFNTLFSESVLARIHFVVYTLPDSEAEFDPEELEQRVIEATKSWQDDFREALMEEYGEATGSAYFKQYEQAFPGGYREDFHPRTAAADVARIGQALADGKLGMHFYRPIVESPEQVHFRLYSPHQPLPLSEVIPVLENMGLRVFGERPYQIRHADGEVWIHDFAMDYGGGAERLNDRSSALFQAAFQQIWAGRVDNDGFNQLVLDAGLSWRQVLVLRAYSRYLQQIRTPYSQTYIIESLICHARISERLVALFQARFDPASKDRDGKQGRILEKIESMLEGVSSLDQDRILRSFANLIWSTLRTNYFQLDAAGQPKEYFSFKIDPRQVSGMPLPHPMFEIYVFSSRMEGVHLRGGRVARGGLRWSDRMEDFRTEVLGLMKAQMVKNTVIVPVGSKGGFIVKRSPPGGEREAVMAEVVHCYQTLLRGLLDLTDNLVDGEVVPPALTVRHDEDDPYLVIAADKGTATFSDIANAVSAEYGFWLGDAFASGGSAGYDHKKMGITARGAWESVKRNFRELGVDIQTTPFRVVGIGDMSGDVFGNGMLLSRQIRLVGAFNHQHIFIDPEPDPEISFQERERLFRLPRSSWKDYDKKLISTGGGVFSRSLKSIPVSDEMRALLGTTANRMTPNELISSLLKAPVDLLWNGGIGTYVKAASESDADVRDKANDGVRVNGHELRCKVVGEGGNLGVTQLGRVEYALKGGLIYTDAIDNSAGVDCSDHEVNIKILLGQVMANGEITGKQRNRLLVQMTDPVAALVLAHNYAQTQAISMVAAEAHTRLYEHARFIDYLEQKEMLNRSLEGLPDSKAIAERQAQKKGLTKPEIAILHAYSKMNYYNALIQSGIPDDPYLQSELSDYFPPVLAERFRDEMFAHRLRREIIATHLTNSIVDHVGPGFGYRVREQVGANVAGVTRAYLTASRIFATDALWREIEAQDGKVVAQVQIRMMQSVAELLEHAVLWILRYHPNNLGVGDLVAYYQEGVAGLAEVMPKPLAAKDRLILKRRVKGLTQAGVPAELARRVGAMAPLTAALDIVDVARQNGRDIAQVASVYFNLGAVLDFHWLRSEIEGLGVQTHWHNLAKVRLLAMLDAHQREITARILQTTRPYKVARKMIDQWIEANRYAFDRHQEMIEELKARTSVDFAMLSVVVASADSLRVTGQGQLV